MMRRPFLKRETAVVECGLAVLVFLLGGCGPLIVMQATPRPNVALSADRVPAALRLADAIPDQFVIPGTASVREIHVSSWRSTLQAGFDAAFPNRAPQGGLEILSVELSFAPLAMDSTGTTRAVAATIRYRARLVGADGSELGLVAETVRAREAITNPASPEMTRSAGQAVEAMYEHIASTLLSQPTSSTPDPVPTSQ